MKLFDPWRHLLLSLFLIGLCFLVSEAVAAQDHRPATSRLSTPGQGERNP